MAQPFPAKGIIALDIGLRLARQGSRPAAHRSGQPFLSCHPPVGGEGSGYGSWWKRPPQAPSRRHRRLPARHDGETRARISTSLARQAMLASLRGARSPPGRRVSNACVSAGRLRHLGKGSSVAQGSGLALDDRQIMPPVIDRAPRQMMGSFDDAVMFAQDLPLSYDHDRSG